MATQEDMQLAVLFPGQGSQTVGMGRALFDGSPVARAVFEEADEALGFALSEIIFEGPEDDLRRTEHTQPAILTVSVAAYRVLTEALGGSGVSPAFAAGHSLGEYSAHVAAGTFSFADAVRTVRSRGRYMQEAVLSGEGAMAAILGLPVEQIYEVCGHVGDEMAAAPVINPAPTEIEDARRAMALAVVAPANLNSPDQTVISGAKGAVERAAELCKAAGAKRTVMLPVSAPFHCRLMQPAQERLATDLEGIAMHDPAFPVACNVDARMLTRGPDVRDCLIRQVTGAVRWVECIHLLVREGATHFVEVGPGKVLTGLMRQIDRGQVAANVEDMASVEKTVNLLTGSAS